MPGDRDPIKIEIDGETIEWGDVHMGRCTLTHHGLNYEASPFLKKSLPGLDLNVRDSEISEEIAYRLTYTLAQGKWAPNEEMPSDSIVPYYKQILEHVGYFAVCGAKGCIRACVDFQERTKNIEQTDFKVKIFEREEWKLSPPKDDETGGIAERKFPEKYNNPDLDAGCFGKTLQQE